MICWNSFHIAILNLKLMQELIHYTKCLPLYISYPTKQLSAIFIVNVQLCLYESMVMSYRGFEIGYIETPHERPPPRYPL